MDQLRHVLAACIIGGTSEDDVWGETPFTSESPAAIGRKLDGWQKIGTIRSIQEDATALYDGEMIPQGQVDDIVSYMIAEVLSEYCENCAVYGGYCGICQGTYWDKNTYAK